MNDWVTATYNVLTIIEIGILEYVIRQVDFDRINSLDPPWVRWARRSTFSGAELFLCFTMYTEGWLWIVSPVDVGLILFGDLILSVNIVSLHLRSPPRNGHGYRLPVGHAWWRKTIP